MSDAFGTVAIVGAGAVGCFYGAMLARAGRPVVLIGRPTHVEAMRRNGLKLDMAGHTHTARVEAATDLSAVRGAGLVLVAVKSTDTEAVARDLAPHVAAGTVVISLQNGIDNAATLARHLPATVLPGVVYVATAMTAPGTVQHYGGGQLIVGAPEPASAAALRPTLDALARLFESARVPITVADDVCIALWDKLLVNCAYNAVSALAQAPYAQLAAVPAVRELQDAVVREVITVAAAEGVTLSHDAAREAVARIAQVMPGQRSSTAQDLAQHKPTEIDHLNGAVARRAAAHGLAAPVNHALWALVKLAEASHARP
jgi:2-dehydropantoate 2-reductase